MVTVVKQEAYLPEKLHGQHIL